jgi:hypothetical protein
MNVDLSQRVLRHKRAGDTQIDTPPLIGGDIYHFVLYLRVRYISYLVGSACSPAPVCLPMLFSWMQSRKLTIIKILLRLPSIGKEIKNLSTLNLEIHREEKSFGVQPAGAACLIFWSC